MVYKIQALPSWAINYLEQLPLAIREPLLNNFLHSLIKYSLIADLKKLILNFDECCFAYTRRANNFVSHSLAKKALQLECSAEWKDCFPGWLHELAHADCKGSCPSVT